MYTLLVLFAAALLVLVSYYIFGRKSRESFEKYLKVLSVAFAIVGLVRYILADSFVEVATTAGYDLSQSFARWFYYMGYVVLPLSVFFDNRLIRNLASCVVLPAAVYSAFIFNETMGYFLTGDANGLRLPAPVRYVYYIIELTLAIGIPILMQLCYKHGFRVNDKEEWSNFLLALPGVLYQLMPVYIPQSLVGWTNIDCSAFSAFHLGWMLLMAVEIVTLILVFRKKSAEDKYRLCVFLSLGSVFNTLSVFLRGFRINRLPIQLCSIAAIFYFVAIVFKKKKLFHFCFIANIIGALVAIFLASFSDGAFGFWNLHYIYEHTFVLVIPTVAAALGVFPRVEKSSLKFIWGMFSIYFLTCLVAGTFINGFSEQIGYSINFFYMLDAEEAVSYVPFAGFVGAWELKFANFTVYPILVAVVYSAYIVFCGAFYGIMQLAYALRDGRISLTKLCKRAKSFCVKKEI